MIAADTIGIGPLSRAKLTDFIYARAMRHVPSRRDHRSAERRVVGIAALLREAGGTKWNVDLQDLSMTGFRFESLYSIAVGARVFLTIPTFAPLEAEVAWRSNTGFGCRFAVPLHPAVFDTIAARYPR